MSRKLVVYLLTSLDGAVDDPGRYFAATAPEVGGPPMFDTESAAGMVSVIKTQDTVLLGRRQYDDWSAYWPGVDAHPFADFINAVRKYVVTSAPLTRAWHNTEAVTEPIEPFVRRLKSGTGGDIGVHGSITLAQSLLGAGLVDELILVVGPVVDPKGRRLFAKSTVWQRLSLLSATSTPNGTVWLRYRL